MQYFWNKIWCFIVITSLCGCVSNTHIIDKIEYFSVATEVCTSNVKEAFETVNNTYYRVQIGIFLSYYEQGQFRPQAAKPFLNTDHISTRIKVLSGLQSYVEGITGLTDGELQKFDTTTQEFGMELQGLVNNKSIHDSFSGNISENSVNILATGVNAIGTFLIKREQEKSLIDIISAMDRHVENICDILIEDIGNPPNNQGVGGKGLRSQLQLNYRDLFRDHDRWLQKNRNFLSPDLRYEQQKKLISLISESDEADKALESTQRALKKLKETHSELKSMFNKKSYKFDILLRELIAEGKRVESFYESLKNKS